MPHGCRELYKAVDRRCGDSIWRFSSDMDMRFRTFVELRGRARTCAWPVQVLELKQLVELRGRAKLRCHKCGVQSCVAMSVSLCLMQRCQQVRCNGIARAVRTRKTAHHFRPWPCARAKQDPRPQRAVSAQSRAGVGSFNRAQPGSAVGAAACHRLSMMYASMNAGTLRLALQIALKRAMLCGAFSLPGPSSSVNEGSPREAIIQSMNPPPLPE